MVTVVRSDETSTVTGSAPWTWALRTRLLRICWSRQRVDVHVDAARALDAQVEVGEAARALGQLLRQVEVGGCDDQVAVLGGGGGEQVLAHEGQPAGQHQRAFVHPLHQLGVEPLVVDEQLEVAEQPGERRAHVVARPRPRRGRGSAAPRAAPRPRGLRPPTAFAGAALSCDEPTSRTAARRPQRTTIALDAAVSSTNPSVRAATAAALACGQVVATCYEPLDFAVRRTSSRSASSSYDVPNVSRTSTPSGVMSKTARSV